MYIQLSCRIRNTGMVRHSRLSEILTAWYR